MFLSILLYGVSILCKNAKFPKKIYMLNHGPIFQALPQNSKFRCLGFFCPGPKVSKKVCRAPLGQKLREEIYFQKIGRFNPGQCGWYACVVSLPLHDVIFAQLTCPLNDIIFCLPWRYRPISL
jgi:hypothetical protein